MKFKAKWNFVGFARSSHAGRARDATISPISTAGFLFLLFIGGCLYGGVRVLDLGRPAGQVWEA